MPTSTQAAEAKILYVDDSEAQRYALSHVLRRAGFEVSEAATGHQALDLVEQHPDAVVLDVNLPDISGLEVCRRIKANRATAHTPILQVSATAVSTDARVAGLEGGADAYLVQPIAADELIATLRALLRVRRSEEAFWRSNEQYRLFFEATPLPCWVFDTENLQILAVNPAAVETYGYSRDEFTQLTLREIVTDESLPRLEAQLHDPAVGRPGRDARKHRTKDRRIIDVEVTWSPLRLSDHNACLAIVQDVTERKQREEAQRKEELQRLLLERVFEVQEEERRRIARELHDEAGQLLTSLLVGLRTLSDARRLTAAKEHAERLREIASQAISELSRLARGLHSSILEDLGLLPALRRYIEELSATHKIVIDLDFDRVDLSALDQRTQLNLYRIVQEALTNILRHSQATAVKIGFEPNGQDLAVSIIDNGRGFPASMDSHAVHHLGIAGMRERAAILGGNLKLSSHPGHGVTVHLLIPGPKKTSAVGETLGSNKIA